MSHARALLLDHGINVAPSGRLRFGMVSPVGSLCVGILARLIALHMMSLIMELRWWRDVDRLHDRPCMPLASTALPHAQVQGEQALVPSLYATARRISSSDNRSPIDGMGGACNQSPEWGHRPLLVDLGQHLMSQTCRWLEIT